jgi:cytochrome-b5 reductase
MTFNTSTLAIVGGFSIICVIFFYLIKNKRSSDNTKQSKRKNVIITLQNPDTKYTFTLAHKENVSHDTRLFRFQLPSIKHILGLPVGQHIYLTAHINDELVKRPYTPTTSDDNQGYFDLVIKIYPLGKMTQYLDKLSIGQTVDVSGPSGNIIYKDNGLFDIRSRKPEPFVTRRVRRLGLIAGGTGITPMYQILNEILKEQTSIVPGERVDIKIWLLFANQTEQDILLRDELEQLAASNSDRFKLWYTVDRESDGWKYSKGFINDTMLSEHMPPPGDDVLICICGPPPMIKYACLPNLDKLGYTESMRYTF